MKADKAARISGYLTKNSVRASLMKRDRSELPDYYEKGKYLENTMKAANPEDREKAVQKREKFKKHAASAWIRGIRLVGGRNSKWSLLSFALIVIMLLLVMKLI